MGNGRLHHCSGFVEPRNIGHRTVPLCRMWIYSRLLEASSHGSPKICKSRCQSRDSIIHEVVLYPQIRHHSRSTPYTSVVARAKTCRQFFSHSQTMVGRIIICVFIVLAYFLIILPFFILRGQRAEVADYDASIANLPPLANCAPLLSAHWIPLLLGLIDKLGHKNMLVSIVENGSIDKTRAALQELERMLTQRGVPYTFRYEEGFRYGVKFQTDGLLQPR
jgi:Cryptococcal mannosyltransferase 1